MLSRLLYMTGQNPIDKELMNLEEMENTYSCILRKIWVLGLRRIDMYEIT